MSNDFIPPYSGPHVVLRMHSVNYIAQFLDIACGECEHHFQVQYLDGNRKSNVIE